MSVIHCIVCYCYTALVKVLFKYLTWWWVIDCWPRSARRRLSAVWYGHNLPCNTGCEGNLSVCNILQCFSIMLISLIGILMPISVGCGNRFGSVLIFSSLLSRLFCRHHEHVCQGFTALHGRTWERYAKCWERFWPSHASFVCKFLIMELSYSILSNMSDPNDCYNRQLINQGQNGSLSSNLVPNTNCSQQLFQSLLPIEFDTTPISYSEDVQVNFAENFK